MKSSCCLEKIELAEVDSVEGNAAENYKWTKTKPSDE